MASSNVNANMIRLRDYSSIFSRRAFTDILEYNDYSHFNWLCSKYEMPQSSTYFDIIKTAYSLISKHYRCEYIYKNELIKLLLNNYGVKNTIYFSEFRVRKSIADIAMFNGESKVFEIKTEYDTPRRLDKQMEDYKGLFDKCFIVIPKSKVNEYCDIVDPLIGIITMERIGGKFQLEELRPAIQNQHFDTDALMSCLRIDEYKSIVSSLGFSLDGVAGYDLFKFCRNIISQANTQLVKQYFLSEIKKRKNNTALLKKYPMSIRQMMLSLNLSKEKADKLLQSLNTNIYQS